jgi:hypothetical protein
MIKLMDLIKEYNSSQLDYIARNLNININDEYKSLMNALDSQGIKYPILKDKITKGEIKTFDDLKNLRKKSKTTAEKEVTSNAEKIFEDDRFLVVVPLTYQANCKYGKGTQWCTTMKDPAHWRKYTEDDRMTLYYILDKTLKQNNPLYKIAILVDENNKLDDIYDATDTDLDIETVKYTIKYLKSKGVKFISKISKILKNTEKETEVEVQPQVKSYVDQYIKNGSKGNLIFTDMPITSLPDNLTFVGGNLYLNRSQIESLGKLNSVGENLYLRDTPLSKKYSEEEIRQIVDVKGKIYM